MSSVARASFCALSAAAALACGAGSAYASFGVEEKNFEAGTCVTSSCTYATVEKNHAEAFTQSAGHPPFGITAFELNHKKELLNEEPEGAIKRLRVDVPPGLAADPEALPKCPATLFSEDKCPANTKVGINELVVWLAATRQTLSGNVYNLEQPEGLPLEFGIHVEVPLVANEHIFLKGHVAWSSDYHEYFEIDNISKSVPVLKSKLIFDGHAGQGNFLTLPTVCSASTTSYLEVESWTGEISKTQTHTPVGVAECERDPFEPSALLSAETTQSDEPDGVSVEVRVPQNVASEQINTADIKDVQVTLPEGLTLNPAAAHGLQACSADQIKIGSSEPVSCPPGSKVGTVAIETDLPPGALTGVVYLGEFGEGPITGPPYTIFLDVESPRYGVSVRLRGTVSADPVSGRLQATFAENPQLPFSSLAMHMNGGARAPLANPLGCESGSLRALFTPYTGLGAVVSSTPFAASGCPSPLPFSLAQGAATGSPVAGAETSYAFSLARADGQQYLSSVSTVLPPGLVGRIPSVTLCEEPQAQAGSCSAASRIGTASVSVGAGSEPYVFSGPVYLTGPYGGAPFGLSIPVAAAAGPFNLGTVVTRASIGVDPHSARVIATSTLPRIVGGVPLRLRSVGVTVDRQGFLLNPTSCAPLATDSTLTSTAGATQAISSTLQLGGCGSLAFAPSFTASSSANASKANGASLQVTVAQGARQANIRSVVATLPVQLPSRLTTLQKACGEAIFAADPHGCPSESVVGVASAVTPVLPGTLSGPAYLVSHGGAAFPDLDLVLEDGLVRVVLVGNTNIAKGLTTSSFASIPDVPVSSFQLTLPMGPHSALAAYGDLCAHSLVMPTTITAQSGAQIKQNTVLSVAGCAGAGARSKIRIVRRRIRGHMLILTLQASAPGRVLVTGKDLRSASRRLLRASRTTMKVRLSRRGLKDLRRRHPLKIRVRVRLLPAKHGEAASGASTLVSFRR
ncbi:MAG: hypothetical protein QOI03_1823 [Solirubrobacteraceae bacterium]|nr:hypothetical protein [Solirubrobacteraceae bacterium]